MSQIKTKTKPSKNSDNNQSKSKNKTFSQKLNEFTPHMADSWQAGNQTLRKYCGDENKSITVQVNTKICILQIYLYKKIILK